MTSRFPTIKTAVFPVAGFGTRFLPASKAIPKEMLVLIDRPLIQYAVQEAIEAGIEKFIFITSSGKTPVEDYFDANAPLEDLLTKRGKSDELKMLKEFQLKDGSYAFVRQSAPLGLGHAVWCARHLVGNEPFALLLPDDVISGDVGCLKQMIDLYHDHPKTNILAVQEVALKDVSKYGILEIDQTKANIVWAKGFVEKPSPEQAPSRCAIIGRYILQPEIFDLLENIPRGSGGEIQLTDSFAPLHNKYPFLGLKFRGNRFDCGNREGLLEATVALAYNHKDLKSHLLDCINKYCIKQDD